MGQTSSISHRERLHVGQLLAAYKRNDHNKRYPLILSFVLWLCMTSKKPTIAFHMTLNFQISGLPMFDTFLGHLSNSDNRDKFCVAVVLWKPLSEGHASLLLAGMFTHGPGATVRWGMYDPNFPFDYTCHDAAYTQAYAALLQKVQHRLQQAVAALPYEAHVAQIACNSRGAGLNATQGDLQRSCLRMSHTKGMCMLICLSVLTQLVDNAIICNVSEDKYVRALRNFSVIDNCICSYMRELSETCLRTFQSNCHRALVPTLMQLKLLTDPDVRLYMLSDDDDPSIFNRRLTNRANGGFDFDDIAEFHILWAKHRDWHENANAVSMRYEAYAAYRADFDLQVSMGLRALMAMVVYHMPTMPTIMQPSTEMWPEDGTIPMEGEEDSDWIKIPSHSFQKGRRTRLFGDVETQETQTHKRLKAHSVTPSKKRLLTETGEDTRGDKRLRQSIQPAGSTIY